MTVYFVTSFLNEELYSKHAFTSYSSAQYMCVYIFYVTKMNLWWRKLIKNFLQCTHSTFYLYFCHSISQLYVENRVSFRTYISFLLAVSQIVFCPIRVPCLGFQKHPSLINFIYKYQSYCKFLRPHFFNLSANISLLWQHFQKSYKTHPN